MALARPAAFVAALLLLATGAWAEEWYDAYEKGLAALQQKQGARAAELLERAIKKRPAPGTNLITYGTNRIEEYYPYLRLAQAHLLAGNPEAAREALARSEAKGKEPAVERARIAALAGAALEKARAAAVTPPPPIAAAPTPPPAAPPATVAAAHLPPPAPQATAPALPPAAAPGAAVGTLEVKSEPAGATVLLAGRLLGATPLKVDVPPGVYQVTLRKEGFADQSFTAKVVAGRTGSESRALAATAPAAPPTTVVPEVASLVMYSDPPGATVYLDDQPLGTTDPGLGRLVKSGVSPGPHTVRFSLPGRADLVQTAQVAPSGLTTLRGSLVPVARPGLPLPALAASVALVVLAGLGVAAWQRRRRAVLAPVGTVVLPATATVATPATAPTSPTPVAPRKTAISPPTEVEETRAMSPPTVALPGGAGERFGPYVLQEQLGKGGMASVFKAERGGEVCALKRPLAAFLEEPEFLERFLREAEIGRTLHHPNIIRIFERGEVNGVPYFTMELVEGETLSAHVRRKGALEPRSAARIIVQVAEALDYAHLKGVVHRDLKPSNIMVLEDGAVKVMDYGIARARRFGGLTVTGAFLGTPDYVAPETAEGKGTDARSDLYSLGIVFYEILTGKKPFVADTPFATLRKHVSEAPTPPSAIAAGVPHELEAIILKLLRKDPAERHADAEVLLIELREYLNRAA